MKKPLVEIRTRKNGKASVGLYDGSKKRFHQEPIHVEMPFQRQAPGVEFDAERQVNAGLFRPLGGAQGRLSKGQYDHNGRIVNVK